MRVFRVIGLMLMFMLYFSFIGFAADEEDTTPKINEDSTLIADKSIYNYTIVVPKRVVLQEEAETGLYKAVYKVEVVDTNIDSISTIVIEPTQNFELKAVNKEPIKVIVEQEETEFSHILQSDLSEGHITTGSLRTERPLTASGWEGKFSFDIKIVKGEEIKIEDLGDLQVATPSDAVEIKVEEVPEEILQEEVTMTENPDIELDEGFILGTVEPEIEETETAVKEGPVEEEPVGDEPVEEGPVEEKPVEEEPVTGETETEASETGEVETGEAVTEEAVIEETETEEAVTGETVEDETVTEEIVTDADEPEIGEVEIEEVVTEETGETLIE